MHPNHPSMELKKKYSEKPMPQTQIHPKKKKNSTLQFLHSFLLAPLIPFGLKKANEKKPIGLFTTPLIPKPKLPNQFSQKNH